MNYAIKRNGLTFCVDYYVELLGVLCILCENQEAIHDAGSPVCNDEYVREVKDFFKDADSVKLTNALEVFSKQYYFNYDAPVHLMLMLSNNQPIDKEALFREREIIPDELFDQFIQDLLMFEKASDFAAFYTQHLPMYETIIDRFIGDYAQYNSHQYLLSLLNAAPEFDYYINFMVGITNANYGATIGNKVYCNICPYHKTRYGEMPDYSYSPIYYSTLVLHEFAHSFINRSVAEYRDEIALIGIEPYEQVLEDCYYGDSIETLINETIIRAIECLYVREKFAQYYSQYVQDYTEEGYAKIEEVIEILSTSMDFGRIVSIF